MFSKYRKWARKELASMASMWEHVTPLISCPALGNKARMGSRRGREERGKEEEKAGSF